MPVLPDTHASLRWIADGGRLSGPALAAQAPARELPIVPADPVFERLGVTRLW